MTPLWHIRQGPAKSPDLWVAQALACAIAVVKNGLRADKAVNVTKHRLKPMLPKDHR